MSSQAGLSLSSEAVEVSQAEEGRSEGPPIAAGVLVGRVVDVFRSIVKAVGLALGALVSGFWQSFLGWSPLQRRHLWA